MTTWDNLFSRIADTSLSRVLTAVNDSIELDSILNVSESGKAVALAILCRRNLTEARLVSSGWNAAGELLKVQILTT